MYTDFTSLVAQLKLIVESKFYTTTKSIINLAKEMGGLEACSNHSHKLLVRPQNSLHDSITQNLDTISSAGYVVERQG